VSRAKAPAPLPDMDDEELRQRLEPLAATLPVRQARAVVQPEPAPVVASQPRKPPRRGIEFLLPDAVVTEIKTRAAQRGVSGTILLLELLRDAGYSVSEDDFLDLRKLPRR
jgi:hypothetical protein